MRLVVDGIHSKKAIASQDGESQKAIVSALCSADLRGFTHGCNLLTDKFQAFFRMLVDKTFGKPQDVVPFCIQKAIAPLVFFDSGRARMPVVPIALNYQVCDRNVKISSPLVNLELLNVYNTHPRKDPLHCALNACVAGFNTPCTVGSTALHAAHGLTLHFSAKHLEWLAALPTKLGCGVSPNLGSNPFVFLCSVGRCTFRAAKLPVPLRLHNAMKFFRKFQSTKFAISRNDGINFLFSSFVATLTGAKLGAIAFALEQSSTVSAIDWRVCFSQSSADFRAKSLRFTPVSKVFFAVLAALDNDTGSACALLRAALLLVFATVKKTIAMLANFLHIFRWKILDTSLWGAGIEIRCSSNDQLDIAPYLFYSGGVYA